MEELERLMSERRRYKRKRGAWRQVSYETTGIGPDGRPPWCRGCAWWHAMSRGGCLVFMSCLDRWWAEDEDGKPIEGECAAWADEEGRARIEQAIAEYARRFSRGNRADLSAL